MTKFLEDALGLPPIEETISEEPEAPAQTGGTEVAPRSDLPYSPSMIEGSDHAQKMDALYQETLAHAQSIMDLGFNMDPARAPRLFEVAAGVYKVALDAANSKRDAQLKAIKLMQDQMKIDMARQTGPAPSNAVIDASAVVIENRNELLKRLKKPDSE